MHPDFLEYLSLLEVLVNRMFQLDQEILVVLHLLCCQSGQLVQVFQLHLEVQLVLVLQVVQSCQLCQCLHLDLDYQ